jgi:hypothetical protein
MNLQLNVTAFLFAVPIAGVYHGDKFPLAKTVIKSVKGIIQQKLTGVKNKLK